ncbi:pentatricopeptide repeat-containing protein at3g49740 [Phtheirospermum japonicum]|uniref:Pentatricopeptide repeat-containing protein at3g49740 n=1 Tax=Phtheirospermum japonicum TaxID=374723 RepID=A0A830B348_9LAMI|nr:pentatricopeptide repeat-containing protein at3g49740 [Phtheirospermum japonicum]
MRSKYYREIVIPTPQNPNQELIKLNRHLKNLVGAAQFSDALHLFKQIHSSHHFQPDQFTLSTALAASAKSNNTRFGAQLHARSVHSGLKTFPHVANTLLSLYAKSRDLVSVKTVFYEIDRPDVYSHTTLLSACAKFGEFDYARQVFDETPQRNVAIWNAMITGCAENGHCTAAFDFLQRMLVSGVKGDNYTFASVLSLCSSERFDFGRQVHCLVVKTGFLRRVTVINSLIKMYFNCKRPMDAYVAFDEVGCEIGDEITYNTIIAGLVNMEKNEEALLMFKDMITVDLKPTELTFVSVMGACFFSKIAGQVHGQAIKMTFEDFTSVNNAAISMYSNCGDINAACSVFSRLKEKDVVSWNAIIASYAQVNLSEDVIFAFSQMRINSIEPDEFTIGSLLARSNSLEIVETIQAIAIKKALVLKVEVTNALISAFARNGEIKQASKLFFDTHSKNLISWNSMISGFMLNNLPGHGLRHFSKLLVSGLKPNHYTLSLVLSICASVSDLHHGKEIHAYIIKFSYCFHTLLCNTLIALYSKCGALHLSLRVFENMMEKDTVTWNSILSAHAEHGEGEKAIHWFETMRYSGASTPDNATFTAVLSACSRSGLVSDGIRIFNLMVKIYGVEPEANHFSCIVDLLGRAGFLDLAERLVMDRAGEIDLSVWWTLFSLCVDHGYVELGSVIAEFILEKNKYDPNVYVLLSNLYANAGKWEESANLRELMKKYGVMKQPGSSWITS